MKKYIQIRLKRKTAGKLKNLGSKDETYDQIINRLIEEVKNKWEKRSE
jgi:hypothetical protein